MLPSDCGTPKTFTGVPFTRCEAVLLKPVELLRSCGLMLTMLFVLSTWKTSVAEPEAPLAFTVTAFVPLGTLMPKLPELPFETQELATVPSGSGVGTSTVKSADHALGFAGSFHVVKLSPHGFTAPTVPPKLAEPLVAATKLGIALLPLLTRVGKAKFHHLKPVMMPFASLPLGVLLEIYVRFTL